jgi:hypothetical protein
VPELRCKPNKSAWAKLHALRELWGYRWPVQAIEHLINEAHGRYLAPTSWSQDVNRAIKVLQRVKPTLLISAEDVIKVTKTTGSVEVWLRLDSAPFTVSKQEWEK